MAAVKMKRNTTVTRQIQDQDKTGQAQALVRTSVVHNIKREVPRRIMTQSRNETLHKIKGRNRRNEEHEGGVNDETQGCTSIRQTQAEG